jgi:hypothetical protein
VSGLPDGRYDAFVVDATELHPGRMALELTIVAGEHKGEVVEIAAVGLAGSEIDLLGMPATLTVVGGEPRVEIDR